MNVLRETFALTISGFESFIAEYKYLALVIGIVFYSLIQWKKYRKTSAQQMHLFCVCMIVAIIFPLTGVMLQLYLTRFYDYPWIWSCVPLTAVIAWGIITIIFEEIPNVLRKEEKDPTKKRLRICKICGLCAATAILFMCGNQGRLRMPDEQFLQDSETAEEILEYLEAEVLSEEHVIWGKAGVMQFLRSHSGEVLLFYGRDMWDAKAGAYDYEDYIREETSCYEWMETVSSPHNLYLLEVEQAPEEVLVAISTEKYVKMACDRDVDIIILPTQITPWMEKHMGIVAAECEKELETTEVGSYTIWEFK